MDLMEYQAKELFARHDVPVTVGTVVERAADAAHAAEENGGRVVVKAQVQAGGRGKAGGVKLARTPEEARSHAEAIIGMEIKGLTVHRVLVAPGASIEEEYYFSLLLDRANRRYLCRVFSTEGGVDIEDSRRESDPEALSPDPRSTRGLWASTRAPRPDKIVAGGRLCRRRWPEPDRRDYCRAPPVGRTYAEEDATLVEVNPLAKSRGRTASSRSTGRSPSMTTPPSGTPSTPPSSTPRRDGSAGSRGQGQRA